MIEHYIIVESSREKSGRDGDDLQYSKKSIWKSDVERKLGDLIQVRGEDFFLKESRITPKCISFWSARWIMMPYFEIVKFEVFIK